MLDLSTSTDADLAVAAAVLAALDPGGDERCMVVGATARNILSLALGHGVPGRLTRDVDISVAVGSWGDLETFTGRLERVGRRAHTFRVLGCEVDVVPWGDVEDAARTITWPDGAVMNLVGMREAPRPLRLRRRARGRPRPRHGDARPPRRRCRSGGAGPRRSAGCRAGAGDAAQPTRPPGPCGRDGERPPRILTTPRLLARRTGQAGWSVVGRGGCRQLALTPVSSVTAPSGGR